MTARTEEEMEAARLMLSPFRAMGYQLFPLRKGQKIPRDKGWQTHRYRDGEIKRWLEQGGNIGIALGDQDLVLDVDPRNFEAGDDPLRRLCDDVDVDLGDAPTVLSGRGDGGHHIYYKKPLARLRLAGGLKDYPGIDFQGKGKLMVAPGSRHPETGGVYQSSDLTPSITEVQVAPHALLTMLFRAEPHVHDGGERVGIITPEQLAELLSALDPRAYGEGKYDQWIRLAAACHDATGGGGLAEWLAWCADDPAYADEETWQRNIRHWESFEAGRPGGVTYLTLFKAVSNAGRPDLVAALGDGDVEDFADVDAEVIDGIDYEAEVVDPVDWNAGIEDQP